MHEKKEHNTAERKDARKERTQYGRKEGYMIDEKKEHNMAERSRNMALPCWPSIAILVYQLSAVDARTHARYGESIYDSIS